MPDAPASAPTWGSVGWLLPFGLLVLAIVAVPLRILEAEGLPRHRLLQGELDAIQARNAELAREVRALEREVEGLAEDPATIERIARDELGMVAPGELVFQF